MKTFSVELVYLVEGYTVIVTFDVINPEKSKLSLKGIIYNPDEVKIEKKKSII